MYWLNTELVYGEKSGLTIVIREDLRPGLVLESSPSGRLRLRAGRDPLLWARIDRPCWGVATLRRATRESAAVVRPIRSSEARRTRSTEQWMRFFAGELGASSRSPLTRGTWQLTELRRCACSLDFARSTRPDEFCSEDPDGLPWPARGVGGVIEAPRLAYLDWSVISRQEVCSVRAFSDADDSRVKAWRKHARDGNLPPILLWSMGGIELPILVDGHDRLRAALAERVEPRVVALWQSVERPDPGTERWQRKIVGSYEKANLRAERLSNRTRAELNRELVRAFRSPRAAITTARARNDLDALWIDEVRAELSGDESDDALHMLREDAA